MNCPYHKKYKAVRKPTGGCVHCWQKWFELHPCKVDVIDLLKYCIVRGEVHQNVIVSFLKNI